MRVQIKPIWLQTNSAASKSPRAWFAILARLKLGMISLIFSLILMSAYANETKAEQKDHATHNQALVGLHGMAVFRIGNRYYASHMPLANSIHAHQLIFSFSLSKADDEMMKHALDSNALVSLKPEIFDLRQLMNGELIEFSAEIFAGHFERNGELVSKGVQIKVDELMLNMPLVVSDTENGAYYSIPLNDAKGLMVHKISKRPSYDQIVLVEYSDGVESQHSKLVYAKDKSAIEAAKGRFEKQSYKNARQVYLETQDFQ